MGWLRANAAVIALGLLLLGGFVHTLERIRSLEDGQAEMRRELHQLARAMHVDLEDPKK